MLEVETRGNDLIVRGVDCLSLPLTLDCGQAFRWRQLDDGRWHGVVCGCALTVGYEREKLVLYDTKRTEFERIWSPYFDLERDYPAVLVRLCADPVLARAVRANRGIRILRQEPWEALCSFIISQNNNIPRIKGIISRLCEYFGEETTTGDFTFPPAERLAALEPEDLAPLRAGFRARYIIDAARRVSSGEVRLDRLSQLPLESARSELMKITGVGNKVADCTLLYGVGCLQICPMDVWMKRVLAEYYPQGFPACARGVEGIAQQYLFHYARTSGKLKVG